MKFEGSKFEERYNTFWNDQVVAAYDKLWPSSIHGGPGFFTVGHIETNKLLKQYCDGVMNIVNNVIRGADSFEDKAYVASYLNSTKDAATADLKKFLEQALGGAKSYPPSVELIRGTLAKLAQSHIVSSMDVPSSETICTREEAPFFFSGVGSTSSFFSDIEYSPLFNNETQSLPLFCSDIVDTQLFNDSSLGNMSDDYDNGLVAEEDIDIESWSFSNKYM